MCDIIEINEIPDLDSAKHILSTHFSQQVEASRGRVDASDVDGFEKFVGGYENAISEMQISEEALAGLNEDKLLTIFWKKVYTQSEFQKRLKDSATHILEERLSNADSSEQILNASGKLEYVRSGNIVTDLQVSKKLAVTPDDHLVIVNEVFATKPDPNMVQLLDSAREYIRENKPNSSFMLLSVVQGKRYGFGVEIEDGEVKRIGIDHINLACRVVRFDRVIDTIDEVKPGVKILPVTSSFSDFPDSFHQPYTLSDDLFLLKSTTHEAWMGTSMEGSKIKSEIEAGLPLSI